MDIGSLTGEITLEDQATKVLENFADKIEKWAEETESSLGIVTLGFAALTAVIAGTAASVVALGEKGSTLTGVETAFDHLAEAAGTTGEALRGTLSEGLKGTVDDMQMMQSVQRLLVSGFKLTNDGALLLAQTARELGKAFGQDASSELEILSNALATGRTRTLALQGVTIDVKKGEEEFAKSIGTTVDQLNAEGLLEGKRIAIMEGVKAKRDALGESELSFKERVQQTVASLEDWGDSLAKSVAASPEVLKAYDDIKGAIITAFGGDSQSMLEMVTGWVNNFASAVSEYGPVIIQTFADILSGIHDIWQEVLKAWDTIPNWLKNIARDATAAAAAIWLMQAAFFAIAGSGVISTLTTVGGIVAGLPSLLGAAGAALTEFMVTAGTLGTVVFGLTSIVTVLTTLGLVIKDTTIAWDIWKTHAQNATDAVRLQAEQMKTMSGAAVLAGHDFATLGEAETFLRDRVKEANGLLRDQDKLLHQAGGVPGDITGGKIPIAAVAPKKDFIKDTSAQVEAATSASIAKTAELWDQYFTTLDKMNLDSVGAQVLAIDRKETAEAAALDKSKKYNQDYQNQLQAIEAVAAVNRAAIFEDLRKKNVAADEKALTESQAALVADGEKRLSLSTATFDKLTSAAEKEQRTLEDVTTTGLDRQLLDIQRSAEDQIAALGAVPQDEALAALWQANVDKIHAIQHQQVDNLYVDNAAMVANSQDTLQAIADKNYTTWLAMAADPDTYSKQAVQDMKDIADASQRTALGIQKSLGADLFTALKGVPNTIADAFKSGGSLLSAAESLGSQFGAIFGKHIGTSISDAVSGLGSLAGPIGAAIGALAGPLIGLLAKIGGPSQNELAARSTFADFQKQFGTLPQTIDAVGEAYARMGLTGTDAQRDIQRALDATHVSAAAEASALDTINLVLAADKQRTQDLTDATNAVITAGKGYSGPLPAALQVTIDQIMNASGATDAMKTALQGVLDQAEPDYKKLTALAGTYGLSLADLGPKFEQADLEGRSKQIFDDFTALTQAGGDVGGVLSHMRDQISALVDDSLKFGTAIPENMKPLIDELAKSGQLTDDQGNKIEDTSKLTFEDTPLDKSLKGLNDAIDHLSELLGLVPGQLDKIGAAANNLPKDPFANYNPPAPPVEQPQGYASGGTVYAASGMTSGPRGTDTVPAWLTPGEDVTSVQQKQDNAEAFGALQTEVMGLRADMNSKFPRAIGRAIGTALVGVRTAS